MSKSDDFIKKYLGDNTSSAKAGSVQQSKKTAGSTAADTFISKYNPTIDQFYINRFLADYNSYAERTQKAYDKLNWKSATSGEYDSLFKDTSNDIGLRSAFVRSHLYLNKDQMDEDTYNGFVSDLDAIDSYQSEIGKAYKGTVDFYSQWETEDQYNFWDAHSTVEKRRKWYAEQQSKLEKLQADKKAENARWNEALAGYDPESYQFMAASQEFYAKQKAIDDEIAAVESEMRMYERGNYNEDGQYYGSKTIDEYHDVTKRPDFAVSSANRDYDNPTREELWEYDTSASEGTVALGYGGSYDEEGNILDVNGNIVRYAKGPEVEDKLGLFLSAGEEGVTEAYNQLSANSGNYTDTWANIMQEGDVNGWKYLEDTEIAIYYALLDDSQEAAYKFLDDMTTELTRRETMARKAYIEEAPVLEQIMWNAASIPMNVVGGGVAFVDDAINMIKGEEINPYSRAHTMQNTATFIREDTAKDINNLTGNVALPFVGTTFGDVYQSIMSAGDTMYGMMLGGGGKAYQVLMTMGAASSEAKRLYESGASTEQMVAGGILAGAAEYVFEKYSIENLINMKGVKSKVQIIKNLLVQGGIEASEEAATELANTITNAIVMGSQSDWQSYKDKYLAAGDSDALATVKALFWDVAPEVLNAGIGGFISGGFSGGLSSAASYAQYNQQAKETGKDIMKADGGVDALKTLAMDVAGADSKIGKQAGKVTGETFTGEGLIGKAVAAVKTGKSQKAVGKLHDAVTTEVTAQNRSDIAKALEDSGFSTKSAKNIADAIVARLNGEDLSNFQKSTLEAVKDNKKVQEAINGILEDAGSSVNTRTFNLDKFNLGINMGVGLAPNTSGSSATKDKAAARKYTVSENGKLMNKETNEAIDHPVLAQAEDGTYKLVDENVGLVSSENVSYADHDQGIVVESFVKLGEDFGNVNKVIATMDLASRNKLLSLYNPAVNPDGGMFVNGVLDAYFYGHRGVDLSVAKDNSPIGKLTEQQRQVAWETGRAAGEKATAAEQSNLDTVYAEAQKVLEQTGKPKKGTYHATLEAGISHFNLTPEQKVVYAVADEIAQGIQTNIRVYAGTDTAQGFYNHETDEIMLNLNAANKGRDAIMAFTMAHEIVHRAKKGSPTKYQAFTEFLMKEYGKQGSDVEAMIQEQMDAAERFNKTVPKAKQVVMTEEKALEEVVCDACATMLLDTNAGEKLAEFGAQSKENRGFLEDLKRWISDLLERLRNYFKGIDPKSKPAREFAKFEENVKQTLAKMYVDMAVDAGEKLSTIKAAYGGLDSVLKKNAEAIAEDAIITEGAVVTDGERSYSIKSMKADIAEGKMFEDLKNVCGWTQGQVNELKQSLEDLVEYMTPFRDILDMNETYGREGRRFSPYKPNSDPLYKISMDFSTLCSKRLLTQYVIENLQLRENRPMSAEEQMAIRDMLNEYRKVEKGLQVACAMCYVEAARLKSPKQINKWLDDPATQMRNYFADKNPEFAKYIKEKQGDFKESRGYDRNASKNEMKEANKKSGAKDVSELNKIRPRLRSQYQVSEEEAKIIERAKSLPRSTYLTAGNLANLSETDPVIYSAYTAFVRTATRSKSLETDEPYYYGDSTRDNGNGIVVTDSFIESVNRENGMRFSSWSDWRIQHLLDYITAVIDNSVRGAAMHGYTKFGDEVRVLGKTGMMFNMSGVAGTQTGLNEDGSLSFSPTESIDVNEAIQLREEFPETAGLQCIGVSYDHIVALLRSDIIDYVIPYHVSGLNASLRAMANIHGWDDFTSTQHAAIDKSIKLEDAVDKEHWREEPVFSEFFVGYDTGMTGIEAMRASADRYVQMCKDRGLKPKFEQFLGEDNYWKLLIDRKMINQKTGKLIQQRAVTPTFDFGTIKSVVDKYVQNYDSGLEARALNHVVENWDSIPKRIKDLKKQGSKKAKKASKAVDTLSNQTLAAQPKGVETGKKSYSLPKNDIEKPSDNKYIKMVEAGATHIGEYDVVPKNKEPKKTILAWKALVVKPGAKNNPKDKSYGNMYPPQVHQVASTPYGVWLYANEAPKKLDKDGNPVLTKYGRPKVKEGMTYRPAWHFGDVPYASQFKSTHGFFDDNGVRRFYMSESKGILVWALCEMAADENYQDEADMAGHVGETRSWDEQQASLWYLPENGYYKYMTNRVDPNSVTWYLSDKMRIVQTITDAEMRDILTWVKEDGATDLEFNYPLRMDGKDVDPADYGIPVGNVVGDGIDYVDRWKNQFREIAMNGDIDITQSHFYYVPSTATNYGAYETVSFSKEVDDHSQELLKTKKTAKILSVNPTSHSVPTQKFEEASGIKVKEANTLAGRKKIIEAAKTQGYDIVEFEKTGKGLSADVVIINPNSIHRNYKFNNVSERHGRTDAVSYSLPKNDQVYMDAVNRGDMKTAQKMAENAAKQAGYDSTVYHGTPAFGFTKIKTEGVEDGMEWSPFFTTDSLEVAETYSGKNKVRGVSDSSQDESDAISEAFHDRAYDLCDYINRAAGHQSYISYDAFDLVWEDAANGTMSLDTIRNGFYEDVESIVQELFAYSEFYEKVNDPDVDQDELYDQFVESSEIDRIYSAANDIDFILRAARTANSGNYQFYANTDNLLELDAKGNNWSRIPFDEYDKNGFHPYVNTRQASVYAKQNGFDGVKVTNVFDDGGRSLKKQRTPATVYIFFKPHEQVKSADPVTYDDNGDVIPLSQRFNPANDDIRYSLPKADSSSYQGPAYQEWDVQTALYDALDHADKGDDNMIRVGEMPRYITGKLGIEGDFYIYRNHAYENMVSRDKAILDGRPVTRRGEAIHFHDLGMEIMIDAVMALENPIMTISTKTAEGNPAVIMVLPVKGKNNAPLYAVLSFYSNRPINGDLSKKPHIVLTIAEREFFGSKGRSGYAEIVGDAIKDGRVIDFNKEMRDALSVIANPAGVGNITDSSLAVNLTRFLKEIKSFREKNNIDYKLPVGEDTSPRALLANAFEGIITNDIEKRKIQEYKGKVEMLNEEEKKLSELRAQIKELSFAKGKRDTKKIRDLQFDANHTANRIATLDKMLLGLEASTPLQNILKREKEMAFKRGMEKSREKHKTARQQVIETREKRYAREKLQKLVIETAKWISYPSKTDVKCPDILKQPYADFLNSIDLSSKRLAGGGDPTKNDLRLTNAMGSLATALDRVMASQDPNQDTTAVLDTGYLDLPAGFVQKLRDMTESVKAMMVEGEFVVNTMTAAEVRQLSQMIRTLNHAIKEVSTLYANLRFANVEALGDSTMSFVDALGEIQKSSGMKDFVQWENALPYYAFKRFGEGGESIFEGLMDAQDKLAYLAQQIFGFSEKTWTGEEAKAWSEDAHTINLPDGDALTLTTADAMSIYCLSRREQGLKHLLGGGTRVMGIQKGSQKAQDSRSLLTVKDIDAIISSLTDRQRKVAEAIQEFMSTTCSDWGNEISMKRFLTKEFNEKFYFPIESNDENLPTKDPSAQQSDLFRLLNISATKPIDPRANNEVIIRNIFDVFSGHASDMARLNAYGMALLDYMKWLNYREKTVNDEGQVKVRGVRKSMEKAYGNAAKSYVLNLIKDVNGRASDGGDPTILMKWMRTAKTASVGSSLRVATLQITSYPRAALVLSPKSLALGLSKLPQIEKAKKYCGIALWKSFGFYDTNISRSIEDQMKGVKDVKQKLIELSLKGAEWGDAITWGCLWNACEYEVAATKKFKVGSEEFYQEVGKKLREVVYSTQVVDSTLTRSQIMRSKRGMAQEAAAFMSEPTLSANILMGAGFQFEAEKRRTGSAKAAWQKTSKIIGRAVAVYSIGQLAAALLESLWDAWRDDDDEEFGEKYLSAFVENLALDLVPFNKIPIVSDVFEAVLAMFNVGFYSSDKMSTTWLTQAVSAVDAWKDVLGGNSSTTTYNALYKSLRAVSSFYGVAFSGVMREGVALWNNTAGAYDSTWKVRQYQLSKADLGNELYEAIIDGDTKQADSLKAQFEDQASVSSAIRKALRENDPRITEAAIAWNANDLDEYMRIAKEIIAEKHFIQDDVVMAIRTKANELAPDEGSTSTSKAKGLFTAEKFADAIAQGDQALANAIKVDIIQTAQKNGKTEEEAEKSFVSSAKGDLKELFLAGSVSEAQALDALTTYCGDTHEEAEKRIGEWEFESKYGFAYSDRADAYKSGAISAQELQDILVNVGGKTAEEAMWQVKVYDWQNEGFDIDSNQKSVVEDYETYCEPAGIDKNTYFDAYLFYADSGEEGVAYSKTIECMPYIDSLPLSSSQKTALALCWWAKSTVNKYKTW